MFEARHAGQIMPPWISKSIQSVST